MIYAVASVGMLGDVEIFPTTPSVEVSDEDIELLFGDIQSQIIQAVEDENVEFDTAKLIVTIVIGENAVSNYRAVGIKM